MYVEIKGNLSVYFALSIKVNGKARSRMPRVFLSLNFILSEVKDLFCARNELVPCILGFRLKPIDVKLVEAVWTCMSPSLYGLLNLVKGERI